MSEAVKIWLIRLLMAFVNGFASGIILVIAAPESFNLTTNWQRLLMTSTVLGILGMANFIKNESKPWDGVDRRNGAAVVLLLAAALFLPACTENTQVNLTGMTRQWAKATYNLQTSIDEYHAVSENHMSDADYVAWNANFEKLAFVGLATNAALRQSKNADALTQIQKGMDVCDEMVKQNVPRLSAVQQAIVVGLINSVRITLAAYKAKAGGV